VFEQKWKKMKKIINKIKTINSKDAPKFDCIDIVISKSTQLPNIIPARAQQ